MNSFDSRATAPGLVKEGWSATRFRRDVAHAAAALLGRRPNIWSPPHCSISHGLPWTSCFRGFSVNRA